jgi:hypothetical protein
MTTPRDQPRLEGWPAVIAMSKCFRAVLFRFRDWLDSQQSRLCLTASRQVISSQCNRLGTVRLQDVTHCKRHAEKKKFTTVEMDKNNMVAVNATMRESIMKEERAFRLREFFSLNPKVLSSTKAIH